MQLLMKGWSNAYCPTTHVSQQAVVTLPRLLRQRSRWFQGHLQCWRLLPQIARSNLPAKVVADLIYHLVAASLVLVMTVVNIAFLTTLVAITVASPHIAWAVLSAGHGLAALLLYLLAFGMAGVYGTAYWLRTPEVGLIKAILYAHAFAIYAYMVVPAAWGAVWRMAAGRRDWAKTARTVQVVQETFAQ